MQITASTGRCRRMGCKKAILTVAHQLLRGIYAVLREDSPDRDPQIHYERFVVQRGAARWPRKLKGHGFLAAGAA